MELFSRCRNCSAKTTGKVRHVIGSMIKIQQVCEVCEITYHWQSQPIVAGKPAGNLIISAGILFSGALPSKVLRMYKFCKIACISNSTFMNHQKYYLFPSISHVWSNFQHDYFNDVKLDGRAVVLGGDGRADTPGHSAKFGCYSVVYLDEGIVADIQTIIFAVLLISLLCLKKKFWCFVFPFRAMSWKVVHIWKKKAWSDVLIFSNPKTLTSKHLWLIGMCKLSSGWERTCLKVSIYLMCGMLLKVTLNS